MKNTIINLATVASLITPVAVFAQAKSFEGLYGEVGIGYGNFKSSFSGGTLTATGFSAPYTVPEVSINNLIGNIGAGYNFLLSKEYVLGIGASYAPARTTTGTTIPTINGVAQTVALGAVEKIYNIYLSPGYAIDDKSLVYTKVGYTGATAVFDGTSPSVNLTGYVLGLGFKKVIDANLYGFIEGKYASYSSKNLSSNALTTTATNNGSMSAKSIDVVVGVGYKF